LTRESYILLTSESPGRLVPMQSHCQDFKRTHWLMVLCIVQKTGKLVVTALLMQELSGRTVAEKRYD